MCPGSATGTALSGEGRPCLRTRDSSGLQHTLPAGVMACERVNPLGQRGKGLLQAATLFVSLDVGKKGMAE